MTVLDKGRDAKGRDRVKKLPKGRDVMSVTTFKGRDEDTMGKTVTLSKPLRRRRKFWGFGTWILRFALENQRF